MNDTDELIQCVCGSEIPAEGTDFEPQCRFCDRLHATRLAMERGQEVTDK